MRRQLRRTAGRSAASSGPLRVVIAVPPGPDAGDVFGPLDIFRYASLFARQKKHGASGAYQVEVVSCGGELLSEGAGVQLKAHKTFREIREPVDTVLIMPLDEAQIHEPHPEFEAWLRAQAGRVRRMAGLCTGAFCLARAGLLEGRRAVTHWAYCGDLRKRFPRVRVEPDPIFVRDGSIYTSAGAMAGMDLVLALVEEDLGPEVARQVARYLVLFLKRPGGQSQFSAQLEGQFAGRAPVREIQDWIFDHLDEDLSVDRLAARAAMSPRNFRRVFTREVGLTPGKFVENARIEAAKRLLEENAQTLEEIAAACGFTSDEQMRCAFLRKLGVPPGAYRSRFATAQRGAGGAAPAFPAGGGACAAHF